MTFKLKVKLVSFVLLLLLAITLLILPADFFDNGQSICLSVLLFDIECYGCGMTRAVQHLLHAEFVQAYHYNKLSFIVFPLIVYLLIVEFMKFIRELKLQL